MESDQTSMDALVFINDYVIKIDNWDQFIEVLDTLEEVNFTGVCEMLNEQNNLNDQHALICAASSGSIQTAKSLLQRKAYRFNDAINSASSKGHLEVARLLLNDPRTDPGAYENAALISASRAGHLDIVQLLLTGVRDDPSAEGSFAIAVASRNGHLEIVRRLLQELRVDPTLHSYRPIRYATEENQIEFVKLLLQDRRVDPSNTIIREFAERLTCLIE
jgi:ankyrin repeat protein